MNHENEIYYNLEKRFHKGEEEVVIRLKGTLYKDGKKEKEVKEGHGECNECGDRKSTRLNSSHLKLSRMPSSA